jgi:hypothetical protein
MEPSDCENIKLETEKGLLEDSKLACDYFKTFINIADNVIINKTAQAPSISKISHIPEAMYLSSGPTWEVKRQLGTVHRTNGLDDVPNKEKIRHTNDITASPILMTNTWRKGFSQTKTDIHKKR